MHESRFTSVGKTVISDECEVIPQIWKTRVYGEIHQDGVFDKHVRSVSGGVDLNVDHVDLTRPTQTWFRGVMPRRGAIGPATETSTLTSKSAAEPVASTSGGSVHFTSSSTRAGCPRRIFSQAAAPRSRTGNVASQRLVRPLRARQ